MDLLKGKEFVEKILKCSLVYKSLDNERDKKTLLKFRELEIAQVLSNVGITHETSEIELLLKNPLHFMCTKNKPEILHLFLLEGADIEDYSSCTPLHVACLSGNLENIQVLLYHGADTNAPVDSNRIPLMNAIEYRSYFIIDELWPYLDKYEIDNDCDISGKTLLIQLLQNDLPDFALRLLDMDPDVNIVDSEGDSTLYYSIRTEDPRCFAAIFPRVSTLQLPDGFIQLFVDWCRFSETDFKAAFFKILDSPHIEYIARNSSRSTNENSITSLLLCMDCLDKEDLFKALYVMLSYGAAVEEFDYEMILRASCNFKNDLFGIIVEVSPHHISLFSPVTTVLMERNGTRNRLPFSFCCPGDVLMYVLESWWMLEPYDDNYEFPVRDIYTLLEYTTGWTVAVKDFRDSVNDTYAEASPELLAVIDKVDRILANNSVPSLFELARDTVRLSIIYARKCKEDALDLNKANDGNVFSPEIDYHWCLKYLLTGVRQLPIAQYLKNVVMLKEPIYNYDHLEEV